MEAIKRAIKDDLQRTLNPQQFVKTTYWLKWFTTFKIYGLVFYAHYFIILTITQLIRPLLLLIPKMEISYFGVILCLVYIFIC